MRWPWLRQNTVKHRTWKVPFCAKFPWARSERLLELDRLYPILGLFCIALQHFPDFAKILCLVLHLHDFVFATLRKRSGQGKMSLPKESPRMNWDLRSRLRTSVAALLIACVCAICSH